MFKHLHPAYNYGALMRKRTEENLEVSFEKLSVVERDNVNRDIYGLKEPLEESDSFVDKKLKELETELGLLGETSKSAYTRALSLEQQQAGDKKEKYYVQSRKFLVMFLRAEEFDARMTARRITRHFKEKEELFGYEKLVRRIKQEDLDENDKAALYSGFLCITGATDKYGRLIILANRDRIGNQKVTNMKRAVFYLAQSAIEDCEQSQKKGIIVIRFSFGGKDEYPLLSKLSLLRYPRVFRALSTRIACIHNCYSDKDAEHSWIRKMIIVMPQLVQAKSQCHIGTRTECIYQLREYGIDSQVLPVTKDGELRDEIIMKSLETRRWLEEDLMAEVQQENEHTDLESSRWLVGDSEYDDSVSCLSKDSSDEESKMLGIRVDCFYLTDESSVSELSDVSKVDKNQEAL